MAEKKNNLEFDHEPRISELLGRSIEIASKNYSMLLPIFLVAGIVNALVFTFISLATPAVTVPQNFQQLPASQMLSLAGQTFTAVGYVWVSYLASWLILFFAAGVGVWKLRQKLRPPEEQNRLNYASLAGTTLLSVAIVSLSLFLLFIGAIILGTLVYLSLSAAVLENRPPLSALGRSRQLASGRWIKTFFVMAGTFALAYVVSNFTGDLASIFISSAALGNVVFLVVQNFVLGLAFPLVSASMLLMYYANQQSKEASAVRASPSPYDSMTPQPLSPPPLQRFCRNCGTQIALDEEFCHNCGTKLES